MMKKILSYILVLLISVGIFIPFVKKAVAAGICIDLVTTTIQSPTSKASCEAQGWSWEEPTDTDAVKSEKEDTSYHLLEPLPCEQGTQGCVDGKLTSFDPGGKGKLGEYLNFAIRLFIGLCAVAAVVMIVIGGIEYSGSDLISTKAAAKERIMGAVFGLVLALFSWLLLYTINPDLLNTDVDIGGATLTSEGELTIQELKEFTFSGGAYTGGTGSVKVSSKEACEAAQIASQANNGLDPSLILAIFAQETNSGNKGYESTGSCTLNDPKTHPYPGTETALKELLTTLHAAGKDLDKQVNTVRMSCWAGFGYGGAVGLTQFLPTTWKQYGGTAKKLSPWNPRDAIMMTAIKLNKDGGRTNPEDAACKYFGGCSKTVTCRNKLGSGTYGQCVMKLQQALKQKNANGCQ